MSSGSRYGTAVPGLGLGLGLGQDMAEDRLPCHGQGDRGGGMTPGGNWGRQMGREASTEGGVGDDEDGLGVDGGRRA